MDISDIIKDSFKYPLLDIKKFLLLGIPYIILAVIGVIFYIQLMVLNESPTEEALLSSPLLPTFLISLLIFIVVAILVGLIVNGIGLSVMKNTLNYSDTLPDIELVKNIKDGFKTLIVSLVYMLIPIIILFLLIGLCMAIFGEDSAVIIILMLLFVIFMIFIALLLVTAFGKLAETNSIGEALNFRNIYEISKQIGLTKIFGTIIICNIIIGIISLVGNLVSLIPFIGLLIIAYVSFYTALVTYRLYGLLYRDKYGIENNTYPNSNVTNNIPENQILNDNQVNDFKPLETSNNEFDFQPIRRDNSYKNTEMDNDKIEEKVESAEHMIKKCEKCGYSNPDFVNICVNCGNNLE